MAQRGFCADAKTVCRLGPNADCAAPRSRPPRLYRNTESNTARHGVSRGRGQLNRRRLCSIFCNEEPIDPTGSAKPARNLDFRNSPASGRLKCATAIGPPQIWLPFLDTYRTMCLAPHPEFRQLLEQTRHLPIAA
jgi:hypothetical protein